MIPIQFPKEHLRTFSERTPPIPTFSEDENFLEFEVSTDCSGAVQIGKNERKIVLPELLNELDESSRNQMLSQQEILIPLMRILKEFHKNV
jgi:hypothetical protein